MRNLIDNLSSLFPAEGVLASATAPVESADDKKSERVAKEFVKWCWGFGADFRNSPDITNLRFWIRKVNLKVKDSEIEEIQNEARRLFGKKMDQLMRKADASLPQMNTMAE